jgi:hypothetical protein
VAISSPRAALEATRVLILEIVKMRHFKFLIPTRLDNKFSGIGCQFVAKQPCMNQPTLGDMPLPIAGSANS